MFNLLYFCLHHFKNYIMAINTFANIQAFLFDMDGVLFNSMPTHATAWQMAFNSVGIHYSSIDVYLNEGRNSTSTVTEAFEKHLNRTPSKDEISKLYELKTIYFESSSEILPVQGIKEVIRFLNQKKHELWIVTGSSQKKLIQKVENTFGNSFGINIISGDDVINGKPDPEPYLKALEKSGLKSNQAIVIENAPLGVISAKAANLFTVAINTGILESNILTEAGADLVFSDTEELLHWLEKQF
jgi:HAD superfamily hydrolase (TIGR01509 family)